MMALIQKLLGQATLGGTFPEGNTVANSGLGDMILRAGIFLAFALVFFFGCAWAWRTVPALRAILPSPRPSDAAAEAEKIVIDLYSATASSSPSKPQNRVVRLETEEEWDSQSNLAGSWSMSQDDRIAEAIADGRPGSVVRAASALDEDLPPPAIIIFRRED